MAAILTVVAAVAENGVIGADDALPWPRIDADMKHFRDMTEGHPVIMGRVTYESVRDRLGEPLPDRTTVVVTRRGVKKEPGVRVVGSPASAISLALRTDDRAFVAGGESIYRALTPLANRASITRVHGEWAGDAEFPGLDASSWREVEREPLDTADAPDCTVVEYRREDTAPLLKGGPAWATD
jgi:dihydrofolate reductase